MKVYGKAFGTILLLVASKKDFSPQGPRAVYEVLLSPTG